MAKIIDGKKISASVREDIKKRAEKFYERTGIRPGLADADKKNEFDVERYMKRRPAVVKPEEPFEMYELEIEPDSDNEKN